MPKCHVCNYEVHPSIGQCPHCGTPVPQPHADPEEQVRGLLDRGQKIEAVKLYRDQTGVGLAEAKEAVEAIQAGAGPPPRSDIRGDLEAELLWLLGRGENIGSAEEMLMKRLALIVGAVLSTVGAAGLIMFGTAIVGVFDGVLTYPFADPPEPLPLLRRPTKTR